MRHRRKSAAPKVAGLGHSSEARTSRSWKGFQGTCQKQRREKRHENIWKQGSNDLREMRWLDKAPPGQRESDASGSMKTGLDNVIVLSGAV